MSINLPVHSAGKQSQELMSIGVIPALNGLVLVKLGTPVSWFSLTQEQAAALAGSLVRVAAVAQEKMGNPQWQ